MCGMQLHQPVKHRPDASEIMKRYINSDRSHRNDHKEILEDAHPRHCTHASRKHKESNQSNSNHHGGGTGKAVEACDLHDDSETGELELQVRDEKNNARE